MERNAFRLLCTACAQAAVNGTGDGDSSGGQNIVPVPSSGDAGHCAVCGRALQVNAHDIEVVQQGITQRLQQAPTSIKELPAAVFRNIVTRCGLDKPRGRADAVFHLVTWPLALPVLPAALAGGSAMAGYLAMRKNIAWLLPAVNTATNACARVLGRDPSDEAVQAAAARLLNAGVVVAVAGTFSWCMACGVTCLIFLPFAVPYLSLSSAYERYANNAFGPA